MYIISIYLIRFTNIQDVVTVPLDNAPPFDKLWSMLNDIKNLYWTADLKLLSNVISSFINYIFIQYL